MNSQENFRNKIDDYEQTIHAIVGFMNFYRYDDSTHKMKTNVLVFQGRRLEPSPERATSSNSEKIRHVTPDLGVLSEIKSGVLGEVKKSFPKDQELWMKTFEQLMSYDDDLRGWPSADGKVNSHDIVLLVHQTRAAPVLKFYQNKADADITFRRPFIIIQFNRADEGKPYYFFQKTLGSLTEESVNGRLGDGVSVPMEIFVKTYSTIKIYDSQPPIPYLIELIWTNVVLHSASEDPKFQKLRKNQKIDVVLEIDRIIEELCQGFSFRSLHGGDSERQPKIPKREWVIMACEQLVKAKEATWEDSSQTRVRFLFKKYDDVLGHFIELCSELKTDEQLELPLKT